MVTTVLVIDDDRAAAEDYARLIQQRTGLEAEPTDDPDHAALLVRRGGVAVVVLDQQMPQTTGTDLFPILRAADPRVRGILLTGEATTDDVGAALNAGFSHYVHKAQALVELPNSVRHEFIEYQNSHLLEVSADQPVLFRRRSGVVVGSVIKYKFVGLEIVDEHSVREADWQELLTLQAGQTQLIKLSRSETWTLQFEDEATTKISTAFALGSKHVLQLTSNLKGEVTDRLKRSLSSTVSQGVEIEQTFQLPAEPAEVEQVHVRVRRVQQAPVYVETRVEIMAECGCCGRPSLLTIRAFVATGSIALRHVDHFSDGTSRVVQLGQTAAVI